MGVDHRLAPRPREEGKVAVLRGDERDAVALILDELRGRQVSCSPELGRIDDGSDAAFDRFSHSDLLDLSRSFFRAIFAPKAIRSD